VLLEGSGEFPYCPHFSAPSLEKMLKAEAEWNGKFYVYGLLVTPKWPEKNSGILQTQSLNGVPDGNMLLLGEILLEWFLERNPGITVRREFAE